ncbi:hypothetical protein QAD02_008057 [Eretmocerus hayati]|uniref:Uncharacterized protein n=1 Tax=Eretmocerus hayati TaxID=131215 RepID=A0ACC2N5E3_9HYME|nr:hypothetical protein QAD02_008057 [Eretmocerus hayati]
METINKRRTIVRTSSTKANNAVKALLARNSSLDEIQESFEFLELKYNELDEAQGAYQKMLYDQNAADENIAAEADGDDDYVKVYVTTRRRVAKLSDAANTSSRASSVNSSNSSNGQSLSAPAPVIPQSTLK